MVPEVSQFSLAICFAFSFFVARFLLDFFVFKPLAAIMLKGDDAESKVVKCSEAMWKLTCSASMQIWAASIILQEQTSWWTEQKEFFRGWPNQEMKSSVRLFYMYQCGFYLYSIVDAALLSYEDRKKDFPVSMTHHIITSILIGISFVTRLFRIGIITLAIHDTSDVFMEAAKIFRYAENEIGSTVCFGLFAVSWLVLRLIIFPFWIIKAFSYDLLLVIDSFPSTLYYVYGTMLITLQVFHIYWWKLTCASIWNQICNARSEKPDSEGKNK